MQLCELALLTGVNQTTATLTELYAADMGVEYYETTVTSWSTFGAYLLARSSLQNRWGGQWIPEFYDATGYGTVTGLCGANCRHSFYPYWPGISKPAYTKEMLDDIL